MKSEDFLKGMSEIDDVLIEEAEQVSFDHQKVSVWKKVLPAAACLVLIAAIAAFNNINSFKGNTDTLVAYAMDEEKGIVQEEMKENKPVPLSIIEVNDMSGFLFSVSNLEKDEMSNVIYLSTAYFPEFPHDQVNNIIDEYGKTYFYYLPSDEEMPTRFMAALSDPNRGKRYEYEILIEEVEDGYNARLERMECHPILVREK